MSPLRKRRDFIQESHPTLTPKPLAILPLSVLVAPSTKSTQQRHAGRNNVKLWIKLPKRR
jgi:hypothetical protein